MEQLEHAFPQSAKSSGMTNVHASKIAGVDARLCASRRETLTHIDDELVFWAGRFKSRWNLATSVAQERPCHPIQRARDVRILPGEPIQILPFQSIPTEHAVCGTAAGLWAPITNYPSLPEFPRPWTPGPPTSPKWARLRGSMASPAPDPERKAGKRETISSGEDLYCRLDATT